MGEGEEKDNSAEFAAIAESSGLDLEQIDSLKKGFEGFDKEGGGTISQTSMQMILKSMGVKVDKDDMDNYCSEVDEEASGKFTFAMFCAVSAKFMIEDRVATKIFEDFGGALNIAFIRGREPVSIVHYTRPGTCINHPLH